MYSSLLSTQSSTVKSSQISNIPTHGFLSKCKNNLKGTATLMITAFYMKTLNKPCILIPVSSKSVEKCGSYGRLNICKWTVLEAAIL